MIGLVESHSYISSLIKNEIHNNGIPSHRIVLSGFSQGGAMALWTGLRIECELAAIICLSGFMIRPSEFIVRNQHVPVRMMHGSADQVVQFSFAKFTLEHLQNKGVVNVELKRYPGVEHTISIEGIQDLQDYLESVLGPII
jgi:predicted esterase